MPNPWSGFASIPVVVGATGAAAEFFVNRFDGDTLGRWEADPAWWKSGDLDADWHGVFQGGGARGAAYAGALLAWSDQKQWFREVAGSSAGAITAALVAAGFHPKEMITLSQVLLQGIEPHGSLDRLFYDFKATRWLTRYSTRRMERLLDYALAHGVERHGIKPAGRVTFAELEEATGIKLTVVVLDASTGRPLPFSPQWSPDLPVASAVVASCAIPIMIEAPYLEVAPSLGASWRRLADGGVFANYPAFVYSDRAFRKYFALGDLAEDHKRIGFVLGNDRIDVVPPTPRRFVTNPRNVIDATSAARGTGMYWLRTQERVSERRSILTAMAYMGYLDPEKCDELCKWEPNVMLTVVREVFRNTLILLAQLLALGVVVRVAYRGAVAVTATEYRNGAALFCQAILTLVVFIVIRRLVRLTYREGIGVLRTWSGLTLQPPVWAETTTESLIRVPVTMLNTTSFRPRPQNLQTAIWLAYVMTIAQCVQLLEDGATQLQVDHIGYSEHLLKYRDDELKGASSLPSHPYVRPFRVRLKDFLFG